MYVGLYNLLLSVVSKFDMIDMPILTFASFFFQTETCENRLPGIFRSYKSSCKTIGCLANNERCAKHPF